MLLENYLSGYDVADIVEADGGYNYYGFTRPGGSWRVLRENVAGTEYRLAIGRGNYETNFTNRSSLDYRKSNTLPPL
ncbi:MAG: hypothetical protein AABY22_06095 [Nanoarchaeota archaeon]